MNRNTVIAQLIEDKESIEAMIALNKKISDENKPLNIFKALKTQLAYIVNELETIEYKGVA